MSCEQPGQVYAQISMGLGHSQLVHRWVAHDLKYSLCPCLNYRVQIFWRCHCKKSFIVQAFGKTIVFFLKEFELI
jgi:hypothetical protein